MVCDLPVPGGPWMTRLRPARDILDGHGLGGIGVEHVDRVQRAWEAVVE